MQLNRTYLTLVFSLLFCLGIFFWTKIVIETNGIYFLNSNSGKDLLKVEVYFSKKIQPNQKFTLYYANKVDNHEVYSEERKVTVYSDAEYSVSFEFLTECIPDIVRIHGLVSDSIGQTIVKIRGVYSGESFDYPLYNFLTHGNVKCISSDVDGFKFYSPDPRFEADYIYSLRPIYFHTIGVFDVFLLCLFVGIVYFLFRYVLDEFSFVSFFVLLNSISLSGLIISLFFNEHFSGIALTCIVVLLIIQKSKSGWSFRLPLKGFYFGYLVICLLSLFWTTSMQETLSYVERGLPFVFIPIVFALFKKNDFDFNLVRLIISSAGVFLFLILILLANLRSGLEFNLEEFFYHNLVNPLRANAIYISLLVLIIYAWNLQSIGDKVNTADLWITLFLFMFLILLGSKLYTVLAIFITLITGLLRYVTTSINTTRLVFGFGIIAIVISSTGFVLNRFAEVVSLNSIKDPLYLSDFGPDYDWNGLSLRVFQLRSGVELAIDGEVNMFLGNGAGNGQELLDLKYNKYNLYAGNGSDKGYYLYNFHNQYMQTFIELGILGLIMLAGIFIVIFWTGKKTRNQFLLSLGFIFLVAFTTESMLSRSKGIFMITLFPCLAVLLGRSNEMLTLESITDNN